jgi:hypothetical protein
MEQKEVVVFENERDEFRQDSGNLTWKVKSARRLR